MSNKQTGSNIVAIGFWTLWHLFKMTVILGGIGIFLMFLMILLLVDPGHPNYPLKTSQAIQERQQTHNDVMCATGFPEYRKYCQ
jgi:hypothetical protein